QLGVGVRLAEVAVAQIDIGHEITVGAVTVGAVKLPGLATVHHIEGRGMLCAQGGGSAQQQGRQQRQQQTKTELAGQGRHGADSKPSATPLRYTARRFGHIGVLPWNISSRSSWCAPAGCWRRCTWASALPSSHLASPSSAKSGICSLSRWP